VQSSIRPGTLFAILLVASLACAYDRVTPYAEVKSAKVELIRAELE